MEREDLPISNSDHPPPPPRVQLHLLTCHLQKTNWKAIAPMEFTCGCGPELGLGKYWPSDEK